MKKVKIFSIIGIMTLSLCGAYCLGTTQTDISEEQYINADSIESIVETKDGFEIYTNDGVFFFDSVK